MSVIVIDILKDILVTLLIIAGILIIITFLMDE